MTGFDFEKLVLELTKLNHECEWIEFKHNNEDQNSIGEWISAISNSSALIGKSVGYIVWGIEDSTQKIVGTRFQPRDQKIGNEELENWLLRHLDPRVNFSIYEGLVGGHKIVVFEIHSAPGRPVRFKTEEYIRIGSYTKKLREYQEKERALWKLFDRVPFEDGLAMSDVNSDEVLSLIDYPACFELLNYQLPDNRVGILERLISERVINRKSGDLFDITNVGAVLFAKKLTQFPRIGRKALRVILYDGSNRSNTLKEHVQEKGLAIEFENLIRYINDQLPQNEAIEQATRKTVRIYPELAVRELVANALIHQDYTITGAGPMVEIFSNRMEICNPGDPLIEILRLIDSPPRSRNELIASLMRRMNFCEERGSGIDKVIVQIELYQLPPPDFRALDNSTIAVLYSPRKFEQMDKNQRVMACYWHACLMSVSGARMTNASLRKRLGIKASNYPLASRIISEAIKKKLVRSFPDKTYAPFWI